MSFDELKIRLVRSALLLHVMLAAGTFGYYALTSGRYSLLDCLYMTVITLTTVGYEEIIPVDTIAGGRLFTLVLIVTGMGLVLYFASILTATLVEGSLGRAWGRRKLMRSLAKLEKHIIVCGLGKTGSHVLDELVRVKRPVVAMDQDHARVERLRVGSQEGVYGVVGDATHDDDLMRAGIDRADALVVSMGSDVDTLYCTLSARQLNPELKIVVTSDDPRAEQKLLHAGADSVIYTAVIGGMRIASEIVRPQVVTFLDVMTRDPDRTFRFEQITVADKRGVCGTTLARSGLRRAAEVLVVAIREEGQDRFSYNPKPDRVLGAGDLLIVLGEAGEVAKARAFVTGAKVTAATG